MNSPRNSSTRSRLRRRLPWIAGAGLGVLIINGLWPSALPVEPATVSKGNLVVTVDEEGMTRVRNRYVIASPFAGQLQRIEFKPGRIVTEQSEIARISNPGAAPLDERALAEARVRVQSAGSRRDVASAQLESLRAEARTAQTDFERIQALSKAGNLSQRDFDTGQTRAVTTQQSLRAAEFSLQVAQFELTQAEVVIEPYKKWTPGETYSLISGIDGQVLRVFEESARVIPAGTPLLEVGDITALEARIEVLSRDAVAVLPGSRATLEKWGGAEPLNARVRVVEPSAFTKISALGVEEQRVNVIVDIIDPPAMRATLGDGYRVEARIVTWEAADVLKVPSGALFQRAGAWHTYVIDGSHARLRTVKVGRANGLETQILDGLQLGEQVIVYPGDKVADGVRVKAAAVTDR